MEMLTAAMTHQVACVNKLSRLKVGALFMEMGTGKTRCFLEIAIRKIRAGKAQSVVILCPVSGMSHIADEVMKHLGIEATIHHGSYKKPKTLVNIIGIESMSSSINAVNKLVDLVEGSVVILDESQLIKNRKAKRSKRIIGVCRSAPYRFISSGSPMPNGIEDVWSQMEFLSLQILGYGSFTEFARHHLSFYSDSGRGKSKVWKRYKTDVVAEKIAPYSFEARKSDCLDLPRKTYSYRTVHLGREALDAYELAKAYILDGSNPFDVDDATIYRLFTALQQISNGIRPEWLFKNGEFPDLKNPKSEILTSILEGLEGRIVVWCRYHKEADAIQKAVSEAGKTWTRIDGTLARKERDARVALWKAERDVMICTLQSGAMVNNWGFADYAIYLSNSFDYMLRVQSEDRTHRAMMTGKGHYIDIWAETGIETMIRRSHGKKENALRAFQDRIRQLRISKSDDEILSELEKV